MSLAVGFTYSRWPRPQAPTTSPFVTLTRPHDALLVSRRVETRRTVPRRRPEEIISPARNHARHDW